MIEINPPTADKPISKTYHPFSNGILDTVRGIFNQNFYLERGEIVVPGETSSRPYAVGRFKIGSSGHYAFLPEYVHAQDSLAAAAQLSYAAFIEASVRGDIIPELPKMPLESLQAIIRDKTGGVNMKRFGESEFRNLPREFDGEFRVTEIEGNVQHGYLFHTNIRFSPIRSASIDPVGPSAHRWTDMQFQVRF